MQNDGNGNITVGSGSTTTAALKIKGPAGKPDTSFTPDADGNLKISTGNLIIEKGTITAINDFNITNTDGGTIYINNNKKNGGHLRFNTDCSGSNVCIDSGVLKMVTTKPATIYGWIGGELKTEYERDATALSWNYGRNVYVHGALRTPNIYINGDENNDSNRIYNSVTISNGISKTTINIITGLVYMSGDLKALNGNFNAVAGQSDYRLKSNVRDIEEITTLILRPVQFDMSGKHRIGLIAHEIQEQIPCVVEGVKDGEEMQSVNYIDLIPVLIKDIQRLNQKIIDNDAKSESRISNLESRISNLESRISNLESRIIP